MSKYFYTTVFILTVFLGYSQSNLFPPSNLEATVNGNDVQLSWFPPDTNDFYLSWDNGNFGNSIGLTSIGSFSVAARWDSASLAPFENYSIMKIGFFLTGTTSVYTANIWQGPNADSIVFSETVNQTTAEDWTYIYPSSPVPFNILQDLWVGYEVIQLDYDFPAGTDFGPAVQGYGDMINFEGTWSSISQTFGLDYNFNIRVYLVSNEGETIVLENTKEASDFNYNNPSGTELQNKPVDFQNLESVLAEFEGYNVYRDNNLITPVPITQTNLIDPSLELGVYEYEVTAVYDEGESTPLSASVQIGNPELVITPEEITDTVTIGNYYEKIISITNQGDVDLYWNGISFDYWLFLNPPSGILEPGNSIDVQLFISTYNLLAGTYFGNIEFFQNNTANPQINFPVTILALGSPGIAISPSEINFGDVVYETTNNSILTISNNGSETLIISDIVSSNPAFEIESIPDSIAPNNQSLVNISFTASELGEVEGLLSIFSNDEINPQFDVPIFANVILQPPVLLMSEVNGNDVTLNWNMAVSGDGEWIRWDNDDPFTSIGITGGGTFQYAARWEPEQISMYNDKLVPKMAFFPRGANSIYTLKVWQGVNASTLLISQPINNFVVDQWNEVNLQTPFSINANQELWIGIEVSHPNDDYPAGTDSGPAVAGFGDMINLGGNWESMASTYGLEYNWSLQFFVLGDDSSYQVVNSPVALHKTASFNNAGTIKQGKPIQNNSGAFSPLTITSELLGYNVYKDDILLNDSILIETTYTDLDVPFGVYNYGVSAVYDAGESEQSQISVQVGAPVITFNPEMIIDSLENGETSEHIITVSNDGEIVMYWTAYNSSNWITLSENSGSIDPGDSAQLTVTLNSMGLFSGYYQNNIIFETNNLNNPQSLFPVGLTVSGNALLVISPDTLDFGVTALGTTKTSFVTITNQGNDFVYITGMQATPDVFSTQNFPVYLLPGGVISLGVNFTPDSIGNFEGIFTVFTDDSTNVSVQSVLTGSSILPPPLNLTAELDSNNVILDWQNPYGAAGNYLQYSSDESFTGIGYSDGGTFLTATKFGPQELLPYAGKSLSQIGFIPWSDVAEFTLKVWYGENGENLILSQAVDSLIPLQWNDFQLDSPIIMDTLDYLWIGYEVNHEVGEFPAGTDIGPSIEGKSDLISEDGITWTSLSYYGLPYNWNIRGFVDIGEKSSSPGSFMVLKQSAFKSKNNGVIKSVLNPTYGNLKFAPTSLTLLGYNIYRDDTLLNDSILITETDFIDFNLQTGIYSYSVTAVYDQGESSPTDPVLISIEEPLLFPAGWNPIQTPMTHVVHIPTASSDITGFMSPGDWIGVFYNDNGTLKCGGSLMWSESDSLKLIVYGDNPATPDKEGFEFGEWMQWKVFMSQTQVEHNIGVEYNPMMPQYDGMFYMLGISAINSMQLAITGTTDFDGNRVSIYPNPTIDRFTVSGTKRFEELVFINAYGETIKEIEINGADNVKIDFNEASGIYYLVLTSSSNRIIKKVIIK